MINNVILVGRLTENPKLKKFGEGYSVCDVCLAVTRPFKDMQTGEYGVDFIKVSLWNGISNTVYQYTQKGDTIGIKGRLATKCKEVNGVNNYYLEIIGERVAFINLKNAKDGLKLTEDVEEMDISQTNV